MFFSVLGTVCHFPFTFLPPLFLLSPWSALLCLLPTSPGLWLILLLFLVCGTFFGSLCLQRGAGQPKVFRASGKPPSTAVSPVMQEVGRGTPGPPQAQNLSSLFPPMAGSELSGRRGWPYCPVWPSARLGHQVPFVTCPKGPTGVEAAGQSRAQPQWDSKDPHNSLGPEGYERGCPWSLPDKKGGKNG